MTRMQYRLVAVGVLSAALLPGRLCAQVATERGPTMSTAAEHAEARERYARGLQLVNEGKYGPALIEMQRAYALSPSYKILYNLGQIHAHLGDEAAALTNYERFLSEGGSDVAAPRVAEVTQEIAKLRGHVASVELSVTGDGAEVLLDDAVIGRSPFHKTMFVNVGKHKFSATRPGAEPVTRVIPLAGEDRVKLALDVSGGSRAATPVVSDSPAQNAKTTASTTKQPAGDPRPRDTEKSATPMWVGWSVAAAFGIGAGVTGLVAKREADQLRDLRNTPGATRTSLDDAQSSTFRAALVTDVLLGATAVAAGVALYFTLSPKSSPQERSVGTLSLELGPTGMQLRRSF